MVSFSHLKDDPTGSIVDALLKFKIPMHGSLD